MLVRSKLLYALKHTCATYDPLASVKERALRSSLAFLSKGDFEPECRLLYKGTGSWAEVDANSEEYRKLSVPKLGDRSLVVSLPLRAWYSVSTLRCESTIVRRQQFAAGECNR